MVVDRHPRVVVVGAGFGGLWAARGLERSDARVLIVDRRNYHTFLPLLYQVAAAEVEPEGIAYPIRSIFRRQANARFAMARVKGLDLGNRALDTGGTSIPYDYLILATGSVSHFYGIPGAQEHAFPLKTLEQAIDIRNHILCCFERAAQEPDPARRLQALTFAIVGGGATGVEFAGALGELVFGPLVKDFPALDFEQVRIVLLEARPDLLAGFPECCRGYALDRLRRMRIDVRLEAGVREITAEAVHFKDGSQLPTETVVWSAGVRGDPAAGTWGLPTSPGGRVSVLPTLQVPGHPEVYVIGDLCHLEENGGPLPMVAPVAIQQGALAARNVIDQIAGRSPRPLLYRDRGMMVAIGRNTAVAHVGRFSFTGFPAWIVWLSVHIVKLIGFRNRLLVLINWAWDYLFFERAVRLVLRHDGRSRG